MKEPVLKYPGFSVVFIQTFSIHHARKFQFPEGLPASAYPRKLKVGDTIIYEANPSQYDESRDVFVSMADREDIPIAYARRDIEEQIFILHPEKAPDTRNVRRFCLRGFDFRMPLYKEDNGRSGEISKELKGHCNVEMSLFYGHLVSLTYRFLFDGKACQILKTSPTEVSTDDIISFLSIWLGAEFWSNVHDQETEMHATLTDINLETHFIIDDFHYDADGRFLSSLLSEKIEKYSKGRCFDQIALRYKSFIYNYCTVPNKEVSSAERAAFRFSKRVENDSHYAMVDIWENIRHPDSYGNDLFDRNRFLSLSEAEIVNHVRCHHKEELIGLLSMYPREWPYRDSKAYDEVCGENIAIDTDDLVLCGDSISLVLGTYGRRGEEADGVNWKEHLKSRKRYHVSWPEYLVILQIVLARKYMINNVMDRIVETTGKMNNKPVGRMIRDNAMLSMRLSRFVLQMDVVKLSKFPSHKIMYDRTCHRLGLEEDTNRLNQLADTLDGSLHNISDYKSAHAENVLTLILGFISVASAFQLFFADTKLFFLRWFSVPKEANVTIAKWVIGFVAALSLVALVFLLNRIINSLIENKTRKNEY